jgi:hypothetical protein
MRRAAILAAVLALLLPCGAVAQSIGDQQYFDPTQGTEQGGSGGSGGSGGGSSGGGSSGGGSRGTQAQQPAAPAANAQASSPAPSGGNGRELPRTGLPAGALAAAGLALLAAGLALRRVARPYSRP